MSQAEEAAAARVQAEEELQAMLLQQRTLTDQNTASQAAQAAATSEVGDNGHPAADSI